MNCQILTKQGRACRSYARISTVGIRRCYFHRNASVSQVNPQTASLSTTPVDKRIKVALRKPVPRPAESPVYKLPKTVECNVNYNTIDLSSAEIVDTPTIEHGKMCMPQKVYNALSKSEDDRRPLRKLPVVDTMREPQQNDDIDLSCSEPESDYDESCTSESEDEGERSDITVTKQELLEVL